MSEYIVHGTSHNNIESILLDDYIHIDIDEKYSFKFYIYTISISWYYK